MFVRSFRPIILKYKTNLLCIQTIYKDLTAENEKKKSKKKQKRVRKLIDQIWYTISNHRNNRICTIDYQTK